MTEASSPEERAHRRLSHEWPDVLGRIAILSAQEPALFAPLHPELLGHMTDLDLDEGDWLPEITPPLLDPVTSGIAPFLVDYFELDRHRGEVAHPSGTSETAVYLLVYLCPRPALAWNLLRIFVPLLRPGLWDADLRSQLGFDFLELAWAATFDHEGELEEPTEYEDFDWPGSLNELGADARQRMLDFADLPALADPARPSVAPWNRVFDLAWLWADDEAPTGFIAPEELP